MFSSLGRNTTTRGKRLLGIFSGPHPSVEGFWREFQQDRASMQFQALQTARASSLSSQSSFPVSASLPIANSDIERPCKASQSEEKGKSKNIVNVHNKETHLHNLPLSIRAGDGEAEHHPLRSTVQPIEFASSLYLWCAVRSVRKHSH